MRYFRRLSSVSKITALVSLLVVSGLACSTSNLIGNPPAGPTPTVGVVFATGTPGGRVSVWLITPTGQADQHVATPTPFGSIIAPVATATAAYATLQAATATAGASPAAPLYQPSGCPAPGGPPPPPKPAQFGNYPQAIGLYLSAGGAPTTLEAALRSWGALQGAEGHVQADTDLTG